MPFRDGDEVVMFEGTVNIDRRSADKQERSVLCRLPDGTERFVSRNQCPSYQSFGELDEVIDLEVSAWLVGKWEEEGPPPHAVVPGVVVLRSSEKAIQVRLPDGTVAWVPLRGIDKDSPVSGDGQRGDLWVAEWLAKAKGWGQGAPAASSGGERARPRQANIGDDARSGYRGDDLENPDPHGDAAAKDDEPDFAAGDDDLPFDEAPGGVPGGGTNEGLLQVPSAQACRPVLSASEDGRRLPRQVQGVREARCSSGIPGERRSEACL